MNFKNKFFRSLLSLALVFAIVASPATAMAREDLNQGQPAYTETRARAYGARDQWVSNDRSYSWFMDQGYTGAASGSNCGPTSVAMVLKWLNPYSRETGASIRNYDWAGGGWWNTNIIENYLRDYGIRYQAVTYSEYTLRRVLDQGGIALVCLNMGKISRNYSPASNRFGRFYDYDNGHFLVVKGYQVVNNRTYFQVYDPNNWGMTYSDGQPMGKDRLYDAREFTNAVNSWWNTIYTFYQ